MTYTPTVWVDDASPDLDAANLNKLEQGVADAHVNADAATVASGTAESAAATITATQAAHAANTGNPHATTSVQVGGRHHKNAVKRGALGDDVTDNTAVLQALLDEIRVAGRGELYLPGDTNSIYRTKGLWVPPNCRIVTAGAALRFTGASLDARNQTQETTPNPIYANGLFLSSQRLVDSALLSADSVTIDGLKTYGGGINVMNAVRLTVRDFYADSGTAYGVQLMGRQGSVNQELLFERCTFHGGSQNCASADNFRYLTFLDCIFENCVSTNPGSDPGMGLDVEAENVAHPLVGLRLIRCTIRNNSGPGLGLIFDHNANITECGGTLVQGCTITANGQTSGMGTGGGGILFKGGQATGRIAIRLLGNEITQNLRGDSLRGATNAALLCTNNDLRPASSFVARSNLTGYDGTRSSFASNIES